MKVIATKLEGVKILEPEVYEDNRGFFTESYNRKVMTQLGLDYDFVQDNHSLSVQVGTIRGLHFQREPMAQTKLVRVVVGEIYDVAVDIRKDSPTFGQWVGVNLSATNHRQFLIPKGFAHGFCTLMENTHVMYKVDAYYSREHDAGIAWNDPNLVIDWPTTTPILSGKDQKHRLIRELVADRSF